MREPASSSQLRRQRALVTMTFLLLGSLTAARNARGDTPSCVVGDIECGRLAFSQGTSFFDQKDYSRARAWFLAARAAVPHPVISYNLALCFAHEGKPSLARSELLPLVNDAALDSALRERAVRELAAAEAALAHVHIDAPEPQTNRIELDGQRVEAPTGKLAVDPGVHHFRVSSGGVVVFDQEVRLAPGEQLRLRVTNRSRAIDVVVVPDSRRAQPVAPKHSGFSPVWFYVSASATLLLSATTLWSGLDVNSAHDDYRSDLPRLSQAEADARVEDGHSRELRTNLLLGLTAASAAGTALLGLVLVEWHPNRAPGSARLVLAPSHANLRIAF